MAVHIAFLRGINVGGHHKVPMADLRALMADRGFRSVSTYIQSGNIVFDTAMDDPAAIAGVIGDAMDERFGFTPWVHVLDRETLSGVIRSNPFPEAVDDPKSLHLFFLQSAPEDLDFGPLEAVQADNERFALVGEVFFLHAPDGIGRSRLVERIGRGWRVEITARNWRTVNRVMAMAEAAGG